MAQNTEPKWLEEVEEILKEHYQGHELSKQIKKASELIGFAKGIETPSGEDLVSWMLQQASEELYPLAAVYTGFMLGVAWERLQNANRA